MHIKSPAGENTGKLLLLPALPSTVPPGSELQATTEAETIAVAWEERSRWETGGWNAEME